MEDNWISVKDRLPKEKEGVLVWYKAPLSYPHIRTATYMENGYFSTSGLQHTRGEVTHWMPKPKPPTK